jgi:hypothetical protein
MLVERKIVTVAALVARLKRCQEASAGLAFGGVPLKSELPQEFAAAYDSPNRRTNQVFTSCVRIT